MWGCRGRPMETTEKRIQSTRLQGQGSHLGPRGPLTAWRDFLGRVPWPRPEGSIIHRPSFSRVLHLPHISCEGNADQLSRPVCAGPRAEPQTSVTGPPRGECGNPHLRLTSRATEPRHGLGVLDPRNGFLRQDSGKSRCSLFRFLSRPFLLGFADAHGKFISVGL